MNQQEAAAWELHQFLRSLGLPYAVIGGMAVQWWGEPRATRDVDLTVIAPPDQPTSVFIQQVLDRFPARIENALEFARRSRVILIAASNGCPVDISLGLPGYEEEVMRRAVEFELEPGKAIRVCSAEDLIIHKALAGRPQDVRDIEGIVYRQRDNLDTAVIRRWLRAFAELLDNSEIVERFERPWRRVHKGDRVG
ncbi:MAG: nucleotidyl transferase AbiEii/AbiGii toxin family protein [Anaerolineae bacterium]|nr:nucleotidyl transferase AbiEii/AbiGii toxin family protein [Anaerolineae bacterium]